MNVNMGAAASDVLSGRAHVIFHVAAAENASRIDIFESRENFFRRTLGHVGNYIQASAMAHAHHQLDCAVLCRAFENFIH